MPSTLKQAARTNDDLSKDGPAILVSYASLNTFLKHRKKYTIRPYRSWVLDSGAYSVLTSGIEISLEQYTADVLDLLASDDPPKMVFALDVIGDPEASAKNVEFMWEHGVEAVPTFHYGSAWHYLRDMTCRYDMIALGGIVARGGDTHSLRISMRERLQFLENCFARAWPKWIHGFGCSDERLILGLPFASTDSTTWHYRISRYGEIPGMPGRQVLRNKVKSTRTAALRIAVQRYLDLEMNVRSRLGTTLEQVTKNKFDLCLGISGPELSYLI